LLRSHGDVLPSKRRSKTAQRFAHEVRFTGGACLDRWSFGSYSLNQLLLICGGLVEDHGTTLWVEVATPVAQEVTPATLIRSLAHDHSLERGLLARCTVPVRRKRPLHHSRTC
jgi:hypothetical protein